MPFNNTSEFNSQGTGAGFGGAGFPSAYSYGGGFGGNWGGGFGGISPIGLVGISDLFDRDGRRGGCDNDDNCAREAAILSAISNSKDATVSEGRGILAAIANTNDNVVAEGRALAAAVAITNGNIKDSQFALTLQGERNTAQLASQAQAFAIQADRAADEIKAAGVAQTAAILAKLNQSELDNLRDRLHASEHNSRTRDLEIRIENNNTAVAAQFQQQQQLQIQRELDEHRRRYDNREIEINNINTNTAIAAQSQAQFQQQAIRDLDRDHRWNARFDALLNQSNKVAQDIINVGSGIVGAAQTANPTNVNSKNLQ